MTANPIIAQRGCAREIRDLRRALNDADLRVFLPAQAHDGGVFRAKKGPPQLLRRAAALSIEALAEEGALLLTRTSQAGRLYRAIPIRDRVRRPRTARDQHNAPWLAAERVFSSGPDERPKTLSVSMAESPIGWLARRRDANGKPFLDRAEVAAGERLRADFERAQLGPNVTQDWQRFMAAGVTGGQRLSAQEREIDHGAGAARERLLDALDALGPGLSDVALRVCCFLEGMEQVEGAMHWSARSGKVVLKIALQRLAKFYDEASTRSHAKLEAWHASSP